MSSEEEPEIEETEDGSLPEEERLKKQSKIHPLLVKMHAKYFERVLNILPGRMSSLDSNRSDSKFQNLVHWALKGISLLHRMTLAFFGMSGLDVLGVLDTTLSKERKKEIIDWVYSHQILPSEDGNMELCGFRGSSFIGAPFYDYEVLEGEADNQTACNASFFFQSGTPPSPVPYDTGHVAMTYTALACLLILGDDLSRVNRAAVLAGVRRLQLPNGSFYSTAECSENDMRFVYCAACVCYMLRDWSAMDVEKAVQFIKASKVSVL